MWMAPTNTLSNTPTPVPFTTEESELTFFQTSKLVHRCTTNDQLDKLNAAMDQYFNMMAHANAYQLMALKQLVHHGNTFSNYEPPKTTTTQYKTVQHQPCADTTGCVQPIDHQSKEWFSPTENLLCLKPWPDPSLATLSPALPETVCHTPPTTQASTLQTTHFLQTELPLQLVFSPTTDLPIQR